MTKFTNKTRQQGWMGKLNALPVLDTWVPRPLKIACIHILISVSWRDCIDGLHRLGFVLYLQKVLAMRSILIGACGISPPQHSLDQKAPGAAQYDPRAPNPRDISHS